MTVDLADFAETGFFAQIDPNSHFKRFQVVGERSSGTNYASRLIGKNCALTADPALGWKHGFADLAKAPSDLLTIALVRHAGTWSRSMHKRPWHTSEALQMMTFSDFIRAPWDTSFDEARYFRREEKQGLIGGPLVYDRDPETGAQFSNVYTLRRAKLAHLLGTVASGANVVLLRMEPMIAEPEHTLTQVLQSAGIPLSNDGFRGIFRRLGTKFHPRVEQRPATPHRLNDKDRAFMRSQLNIEHENCLGYQY